MAAFFETGVWPALARSEFDGTVVATLRLNPDPSHETKARRVRDSRKIKCMRRGVVGAPPARHPENQMRASRWYGRGGHLPTGVPFHDLLL